METHKDIVRKLPSAESEHANELTDTDINMLDAWLWPPDNEASMEVSRDALSVEPSLLPESRQLLRDFPFPGLERPYLSHLEQRIARNPRDLLSHVRRLYLANALEDADAIAGALTDLFLVLGKEGIRLRQRMLILVGSRLAPEQLAFFNSHLERGLDGSEAMPATPQSRLSKRLLGTTKIVTRAETDNSAAQNPVQLARDSIANGHHDVAQAVLEGALESDPGDRQVSEALLALYSNLDLRDSFTKTYTSMLGRHLASRELWDRLARSHGPSEVKDG
ncbi:MAG: hypothetical protein QNI99_19515 [Woeseiaceae bacterium]|nr:hypothetical protein [Woeseiaceae bacterium]